MEERDRGIHGIGIPCDLKFDVFCDGSGDLGHGGFPGVSGGRKPKKLATPFTFAAQNRVAWMLECTAGYRAGMYSLGVKRSSWRYELWDDRAIFLGRPQNDSA